MIDVRDIDAELAENDGVVGLHLIQASGHPRRRYRRLAAGIFKQLISVGPLGVVNLGNFGGPRCYRGGLWIKVGGQRLFDHIQAADRIAGNRDIHLEAARRIAAKLGIGRQMDKLGVGIRPA